MLYSSSSSSTFRSLDSTVRSWSNTVLWCDWPLQVSPFSSSADGSTRLACYCPGECCLFASGTIRICALPQCCWISCPSEAQSPLFASWWTISVWHSMIWKCWTLPPAAPATLFESHRNADPTPLTKPLRIYIEHNIPNSILFEAFSQPLDFGSLEQNHQLEVVSHELVIACKLSNHGSELGRMYFLIS